MCREAGNSAQISRSEAHKQNAHAQPTKQEPLQIKVGRQRLFIHYTIECGVSDLGHSSLLWKITNKPEPATPLWPIPPPSDTPEAISRLSLAPQTLTHWVERSPMVTGIYNLACKHCSTLPQHCPDTEGERDPATTPGQEQGYWAWLHADSELYHRDSSCVSI